MTYREVLNKLIDKLKNALFERFEIYVTQIKVNFNDVRIHAPKLLEIISSVPMGTEIFLKCKVDYRKCLNILITLHQFDICQWRCNAYVNFLFNATLRLNSYFYRCYRYNGNG